MARKEEIILQIKAKKIAKGTHRVAIGGMLFALAYAAVQVLRVLDFLWYAEFSGMAISLLAWVLMYTGLCEYAEANPPVKRARAVSVLMIIAAAFQILFALFSVRKGGLVMESFLDGKVMLMQYLMILGLCYVAYHSLRTLHRRVKEADINEKVPSALHSGWPCFILMFVSILCVPASALFYDDTIWIAGTSAFCGVFVICEAVMVFRIVTLGKLMVRYRIAPLSKNRN